MTSPAPSPVVPAVDSASDRKILVFSLEGERFGVPLEFVREVLRAVAIRALPGAPEVVEGVVDCRGAAVPVFGLRARFGLPARPLSPDDYLITMWTGERVVAFRVDDVEWIVDLGDTAVEPTEGLTRGARHIAGVAHLPDGLVLVHDVRTFLDEAEREGLERALDDRERGD